MTPIEFQAFSHYTFLKRDYLLHFPNQSHNLPVLLMFRNSLTGVLLHSI